MSAVCGIDLSSRQIDLARLDETSNHADHTVINLEQAGKQATAWDRTLLVRALMPPSSWWDEVYLVALEAPYGLGTGTVAILNRIVGAIAASLPEPLQRPERCWLVRPDEWKGWMGVRGKPSGDDLARLGLIAPQTQDGRDALCIAYYAREVNARASAA